MLSIYKQALDVTLENYVYLSRIFLPVSLVASVAAASLVDGAGTKLAIYTSLLAGTVRNVARALLFAPDLAGWHQARYAYWGVHAVFTYLAQSVYYCLPLKMAESWFGEEERSLAMSLLVVLPQLGSASAALLYPLFVKDLEDASFLVHVNMASATLSLIVVSLCVHRSSPKSGAPSERNQRHQSKLDELEAGGFGAKMKRILAHRQYLIYLLCTNIFGPLMWTINSILQDIFANAGLSKVFCGQFLALITIFGALMQVACSYLWKAKKRREALEAASLEASLRRASLPGGSQKATPAGLESAKLSASRSMSPTRDPFERRRCKVMLALQCATFLNFCHALLLHEFYDNKWLLAHQGWLLIGSATAFILVGSWAQPYFYEQSAELICGRISEPTSSACIMFSVMVTGNILAAVFISLRQTAPSHDGPGPGQPDGTKQAASYKWSLLLEATVAILATALYLAKFNPQPQQQQQQQQQTGSEAVGQANHSEQNGAQQADLEASRVEAPA